MKKFIIAATAVFLLGIGAWGVSSLNDPITKNASSSSSSNKSSDSNSKSEASDSADSSSVSTADSNTDGQAPKQSNQEKQPAQNNQPAQVVDTSNLYGYVYQGLLNRGWSEGDVQYMCNVIVPRESNWNPYQYNLSGSGAYGLFQLMPMHGADGSDVDTQMDVATRLHFSSGWSPWSQTAY